MTVLVRRLKMLWNKRQDIIHCSYICRRCCQFAAANVLLLLTLVFGGGIVLVAAVGLNWNCCVYAWVCLAELLCAAGLWLCRCRISVFRTSARRLLWCLVNIVVLLFCLTLGCCLTQAQLNRQQTELTSLIGRPVTVIGVVNQLPQAKTDRVVYQIRVESYLLEGNWNAENALVQLTLYAPEQSDYAGSNNNNTAAEPAENRSWLPEWLASDTAYTPVLQPEYQYGERLQVKGRLTAPGGVKNPGQFNYAAYLQRQGISVLLSADSANIAVLAQNCGNDLLQRLYGLREKIINIIWELFTPSAAVLVQALVLGEMAGFSSDCRNLFTASGLIHMLCVSGLHVGLVMTAFMAALNLLGLRRHKKLKTGICLLLLCLYAVITGLKAPVLRALIMITVIQLGSLFERNSRCTATLALAAWLLLLWKPQSLFDTGFQLSFAATWGILVVWPLLSALVQRCFPQCRCWPLRVYHWAVEPLLVSLAAQIATLPLIIWYYQQVPLYALPFNIVVGPLLGVLLPLAMLSIVLGFIWQVLALLPVILVQALAALLLRLVSWVTVLPAAVQQLYYADLLQVWLSYALILLLCRLLKHPRNLLELRWLVLCRYRFTGLLTAALLSLYLLSSWLQPDCLEVHFIDVGQGDCMLLKAPGGENILIDAGGSQFNREYDIGTEIVVPYLKQQRVKELDLLLISHPDYDHYGGAAAVVREFPVAAALISPLRGDEQEYGELLQLLTANVVAVVTAEAGMNLQLTQGVQLRVLAPQTGNPVQLTSTNNASVILEVLYGTTGFLLTGDVDTAVLEQLLAQKCLSEWLSLPDNAAALKQKVIKVPHHGSSGSLSAGFYEQLKPQLAVIQVGKNSYGHPAPAVLTCLERIEAALYTTLKDGAVVITSDGRQLTVRTTVRQEQQ